MAQNVTIAGASYLGVPRIEMPKTGGGTAVFVDTSDANAAAGDITKGKTAYVGGTKITGTLEASSSGGAKETWVIKDNAPVDENSYELAKTDISFTSGGAKFVAFEVYTDGIVIWLQYYTSATTVIEPGSFEPGMGEDRFYWGNNAYKTITFDTHPTGALLTWLQANATLQEDTTVVEYLTTNIDLKKVANAIRAKSGTTAKLSFPDGFALAISNISTVAPGSNYGLITYNGSELTIS